MKLGLKYLAGKHERYGSDPAQHRRPSAVKRSTVPQKSTCEQQASQYILLIDFFKNIPKFSQPNTTALLITQHCTEIVYGLALRDIKYSTKLSPCFFDVFLAKPFRLLTAQEYRIRN